MLPSGFCQYFAPLVYFSLYYGVVRQQSKMRKLKRQKRPEGKISKTTTL